MSEQSSPGEPDDRSGGTAATSPVDPALGAPSDGTASTSNGPVGSGSTASTGFGGPAWRARAGAPELEPCQFPGCANTMEYAGSGRRPKYCYQVVGGVMHDRVNAKRIADGGVPARRRGELDDALARPIARAEQTVAEQVTTLISRLEVSGQELRSALGTLADPDAVAAEIAAVRRAARAEVDAAQAATDEARAQARAARDAAAAARRSAAESDDDAAAALAERDAAELARDEAVAAREAAEAQLAATRAELEQQVADLTAERDAARAETERVTTELTAQLAGVRAELETAVAERDAAAAARDTAAAETERVTAQLAALTREHTRTETQLAEAQTRVEQLATERDTTAADLAATRRDRDRAETDRARLADEINDVREQAAEHRAGRAAAESSLAALREQLAHDVDRERAYGEQRLADAETRHAAQLAELRTELARARRRSAGRAAQQDLDPTDSASPDDADDDVVVDNVDLAVDGSGEAGAAGPSRPAGARRARPRAAQRRPGPTQPTKPAPGDSSNASGDLP